MSTASAFCKAAGITRREYHAKKRAVHYILTRKTKKWSK